MGEMNILSNKARLLALLRLKCTRTMAMVPGRKTILRLLALVGMVVFVVVLGMSHRYVLVQEQTQFTGDMFGDIPPDTVDDDEERHEDAAVEIQVKADEKDKNKGTSNNNDRKSKKASEKNSLDEYSEMQISDIDSQLHAVKGAESPRDPRAFDSTLYITVATSTTLQVRFTVI